METLRRMSGGGILTRPTESVPGVNDNLHRWGCRGWHCEVDWSFDRDALFTGHRVSPRGVLTLHFHNQHRIPARRLYYQLERLRWPTSTIPTKGGP